VSGLGQFLQLSFYLFCDTFATGINTIVREAASIALGYEDVQFILWESFAQSSTDIFQMLRVSP
jgi:hypothetical protein